MRILLKASRDRCWVVDRSFRRLLIKELGVLYGQQVPILAQMAMLLLRYELKECVFRESVREYK